MHPIKPHTPPLVRAPVNSFMSLIFATVLPGGGVLNALTVTEDYYPQQLVPIVYGVNFRVSASCSPHAFTPPAVSIRQEDCFRRGVLPYIYAFHATHGIPSSLRNSSSPVWRQA